MKLQNSKDEIKIISLAKFDLMVVFLEYWAPITIDRSYLSTKLSLWIISCGSLSKRVDTYYHPYHHPDDNRAEKSSTLSIPPTTLEWTYIQKRYLRPY